MAVKDIRYGFEHIYIHNVDINQRKYIGDSGKYVIPALEFWVINEINKKIEILFFTKWELIIKN